ncbi:CoA-binding protein [Roseivirga sp. 4D4]|uniref:CoA-binding protein n=1 Tax=Roseivirga sp. 4D4 TaxID=1889784 RepID=UPI000853180A|nr:CoA-binding protein [Roseivirga sp. 4D4]OEK00692.1 CoA-binding protein [Roseivirga sp. 4D4]
MGKTVIVGSVPKAYRYAHQAAVMLEERDFDFIPLGIQEGEVLGREILNVNNRPKIDDVETLTLYINPTRQKDWYDYMISLSPKRIIFNPGTENQEFKIKAEKAGIECIEACTLVMLSTGVY